MAGVLAAVAVLLPDTAAVLCYPTSSLPAFTRHSNWTAGLVCSNPALIFGAQVWNTTRRRPTGLGSRCMTADRAIGTDGASLAA